MPEVRTASTQGEMTQRFIEFVMMTAQQAAMYLGRIPHPQTNKPEINLEYARLFIDQLEMIEEKTRGNLSKEETDILTRILADLRLSFVQASGSAPTASSLDETPEHEASVPHPAAAPASAAAPAVESAEHESRKRFSKSYGS